MRSLVFLALLTIVAALPRNGVGRSPKPAAKNGTSSTPKVNRTGNGIQITPEIIINASSKVVTCPKNSTAEFADECRTPDIAAPFVTTSFNDFNITTPAEAASILSLILFESGDFQFNVHHFPTEVPGQGTRNMMSFNFVLEYAHDVLPDDQQQDLPPANSTDVDDETKNKVLGKVLGDDFSFATGAWFYQKKCNNATKEAVRTGSEVGWRQYLKDCVGTTATAERLAGWNKAVNALSGQT